MIESETFLGHSKPQKVIIVLVPMILGGLIGWFVPIIANWILKLPVVPMEKLILLITFFNSLWVSSIATVIGTIAGLLLGFIILNESLEVTISYNNLHLKCGEKINLMDTTDTLAIYIENKHLIILGQKSNELYREVIEVKKDTVREAFNKHQYPWYETDPFSSEYERWALGHTDFPEKINVLLYARDRALKEKKKADAKYLREDLAQLGAVIRDERNGQYVRLAQNANFDV